MVGMLRFLPALLGAILPMIALFLVGGAGTKMGKWITEQMQKTEGGKKAYDAIGDMTARGAAALGNEDAKAAVAANDKADDEARYKDRKENPAWYSNDGVYRFARKLGLKGYYKDAPAATGKYAPLLDEIASGEAKGGAFGTSGYDAIYSGAKLKPSKPISQMTLGEVKAYQQQLIKAGSASTAVGRYQFIKNKGAFSKMAAQAGLKDSDIFDGAAQDRLAIQYAGGEEQLDEWIKTRNHAALTNKIAQQWASQKNTRGVGNYDGDGLNKARHGGLKVIKKISEQINANESKSSSVGESNPTVPLVLKSAANLKELPPQEPESLRTRPYPNLSYNRLNINPAKPTQKAAVIPLKPTNTRSAPQLTPLAPVPSIKESLTSKQPQIVQLASSSDNIGQNVADRDIAHSVTGGLGARNWEV